MRECTDLVEGDMRERTDNEQNGAPLAVCINDCELDHGQHPLDLVVLCFKVHCAFAKMRWGDAVETGCEIKSLIQQHDSGSHLLDQVSSAHHVVRG